MTNFLLAQWHLLALNLFVQMLFQSKYFPIFTKKDMIQTMFMNWKMRTVLHEIFS